MLGGQDFVFLGAGIGVNDPKTFCPPSIKGLGLISENYYYNISYASPVPEYHGQLPAPSAFPPNSLCQSFPEKMLNVI